MSTINSEDSEILQLSADLSDLKQQVKKLKEAEQVYATELAGFRTKFHRLEKYFNVLSQVKKKSAEGGEICAVLKGIKRNRPIKPHWLLTILLGNHLSYKLLTSSDQLAYKKEYEHFKISVTIGHLILSAIGLFALNSKQRGAFYYDGLVPLYAVVTYGMMIGREAVLKQNGSNIRGWWFAHHLISTFLSALMIIWDKNSKGCGYPEVRGPLFLFYVYIGVVQVLQYRYQMNRLYALRSLSRVNPMETTNELSQNLIHHNLLFLLPFLLLAYLAEFYLSLLIWQHRSGPVSVSIAALYFTLATGNTLTTCYTYYRKMMVGKNEAAERVEEEVNRKNLLMRQFTKSNEDLTNKND